MALYIGNKKFDGIITSHNTDIYTIDTTDATATASDIAYGKTAYINKQKITGINTFDVNSSSTTATSSVIVNGYTAASQGQIITGTLNIASIYNISTNETPDDSIGANGDIILVLGS